jgi:hypothetical protein
MALGPSQPPNIFSPVSMAMSDIPCLWNRGVGCVGLPSLKGSQPLPRRRRNKTDWSVVKKMLIFVS